MKATIHHQGKTFTVKLNEPVDLSIPLEKGPGHVAAWYVDPISITPVRANGFTGSVAEGGSVNFRNIFFNPHGHGTHTECVGHISEEVHNVNSVLTHFFSYCLLLSVNQETLTEDQLWMKKGDLVITPESLGTLENLNKYESLIIRTLPNNLSKKNKNYSDTNPPYLLPETMELIAESGIQNLLIDLPSVDRESDEGRLTCHRIFWNYPEKIDLKKTITEIIYIPDEVADGDYLLELQMAPFVNDASPSRPVIYKIESLS